MKALTLSKDTWHYRNFDAWLKNSRSKKAKHIVGRLENPAYEAWHLERPSATEYATRNSEYYLADKEAWFEREPERYLPARQVDFCTYFWPAVLKGPFARWGDVIFPAFIALLGWATFATILVKENSFPIWLAIITIPVAVALMVGSVVGLVVLTHWLGDKRRARQWAREGRPVVPKVKEPNIFVEKYRQKKQGSVICPFVEFKD